MNNENQMYRKIGSEEEAYNCLINNYGSFIKDNIRNFDKEKTLGNALFCYTGSMSSVYNDYLYSAQGNIEKLKVDVGGFPDTESNIKLIYDAFYINKITENIVLYHYIKMPFTIFKKMIKYNNTFCLNRFMSTTLLPECRGIENLIYKNNYNIVFIITVDKDTPCIPILWTCLQSGLQEYEIILHPKLRLKVRKIRYNPFASVSWQIYFDIDK